MTDIPVISTLADMDKQLWGQKAPEPTPLVPSIPAIIADQRIADAMRSEIRHSGIFETIPGTDFKIEVDVHGVPITGAQPIAKSAQELDRERRQVQFAQVRNETGALVNVEGTSEDVLRIVSDISETRRREEAAAAQRGAEKRMADSKEDQAAFDQSLISNLFPEFSKAMREYNLRKHERLDPIPAHQVDDQFGSSGAVTGDWIHIDECWADDFRLSDMIQRRGTVYADTSERGGDGLVYDRADNHWSLEAFDVRTMHHADIYAIGYGNSSQQGTINLWSRDDTTLMAQHDIYMWAHVDSNLWSGGGLGVPWSGLGAPASSNIYGFADDLIYLKAGTRAVMNAQDDIILTAGDDVFVDAKGSVNIDAVAAAQITASGGDVTLKSDTGDVKLMSFNYEDHTINDGLYVNNYSGQSGVFNFYTGGIAGNVASMTFEHGWLISVGLQ